MKPLRIIITCAAAVCFLQPAKAQKEFPYPDMPQTLKTVQERGAYLMAHYWDKFDFADTTLIHRPEVTEQGFVNFIDLIPHVDSLSAVHGIEAFAGRAFSEKVPPRMAEYFAETTAHYLYDPNSPMRNDFLYILFLRQMVNAGAFDTATRERYAYQLVNVQKNMPGMKAADFEYVDRRGDRRTLYNTGGELILLYFNDPDCENCHAVTAAFSRDSLLTGNDRLRVLAVYPDADTEEWKRNKQPFPDSWTDGYSPDGVISARQIYFIRATPTMYLLDSDKRVILKDPSPELLIAWLKQYFGQNK